VRTLAGPKGIAVEAVSGPRAEGANYWY